LIVNRGRNRLFLLLLFALFLLPYWAAIPLHAETAFPSRISLLPNREYAEALLQGIRNARSSIACSFYLFKTGE